ncbi:hypothetical protein [Methanolobus profundi]|nr:hypothetical protein [Methanolobus profundi]
MFSDEIQKLKDVLLNHNDHYEQFQKSLRESQPIAFFITASLVIATFLGKESTGQQYTLIASIAFFFAYLGLHAYNITKDYPFFYWSVSLVVVGIILLYASFTNVYSIIISSDDYFKKTLAASIFTSALYVMTWSNLKNCEDKKSKKYKASEHFLWTSVLLILIAFPLSYICKMNDYFLLFHTFLILISLLLGFAGFYIAIFLDKNLIMAKNHDRSRL